MNKLTEKQLTALTNISHLLGDMSVDVARMAPHSIKRKMQRVLFLFVSMVEQELIDMKIENDIVLKVRQFEHMKELIR